MPGHIEIKADVFGSALNERVSNLMIRATLTTSLIGRTPPFEEYE